MRLDFSEEVAAAENAESLLDHPDIVMMRGTLSPSRRRAILPLLYALTGHLDFRVRTAVGLIMLSPDYVVAN